MNVRLSNICHLSGLWEPFSIWALSKVFILAFVLVGHTFFNYGPFLYKFPGNNLEDVFWRWDAVWYQNVADQGYSYEPNLRDQQNVVFFPLYPLTLRAAGSLGVSTPEAGIALSYGLTLACTVALYAITSRRFGLLAGRWAALLWAMYPFSLFGSSGYSEPLAILLTLIYLHCFWEQNYLSAGIWGGVLSAARPQGILFAIPLFLKGLKHRNPYAFWGTVMTSVGLFSYMGYLWIHFDAPLAFKEAQEAWRPHSFASWNPLHWITLVASGSLRIVYYPLANRWDSFFTNFVLDPWAAWWVIAFLPTLWKRVDKSLAVLTICSLIVPLTTGLTDSLGRFSWAMIPVFVAAGLSLSTKTLRYGILTLFSLLLAYLSVLWGGGFYVT